MKHFPAGTLLRTDPSIEDASWHSHIAHGGRIELVLPEEVMIALGERRMPDTTWKWHRGMELRGMELVHHPKWGPGWVYREALARLE